MADIKWSAFPTVASPGAGDTLVGLHSGVNYQFTGLTIPFSLAVGGTNAVLTASAGAVTYSTASAMAFSAVGTSGQLFQSAGTGAPGWTTSTYPATNAVSTLLYASSANVMAALATANEGVLITSNTGVPSWLANSGTPGFVLTANSGAPPSWQSIAAEGAVTQVDTDSGNITPTAGVITITGGTTGLTTSGATSTVTLTGVLKLANGGTNANLTASNGGIFYSTATAGAILAGTATASQVLLSGSSTTPAWSTATYPPTTTINQLFYSSANNVVGGITAGDYGVLISSSSGVPSWLANGTTGQVLTATTSGTPSWASPATQDLIWAANSNSSISAAVGNGYVLTSGSSTTVTLPTTFAVGQQIGVQGQGAAWTVDIGASTNVKGFGNTYTTSIASANNTDSVVFIATVANTTWSMLSVSSTGLTSS